MRTTRKGMGVVGGALTGFALVAVTLTSCGSGTPQLDDLQNVNPSYPNYAAIYMDVSGFPNIVQECIGGVGFALTTRSNSNAAAQIVPGWADFCKAQIGKQATQHGQP